VKWSRDNHQSATIPSIDMKGELMQVPEKIPDDGEFSLRIDP
jgi:hypothetical protein